MKTCSALLICFLSVIILLSAASAEIYEWKDSNGNVHFTDSPPDGVDVKIKKVRIDKNEPVPREEDSQPSERTSPAPDYESEPAASNYEKPKRPISDVHVIMYRTSWCPWCKKAREYINSLGANLTEYDIEKDPEKREEMRRKSGSTGVPVIDIEGIIILGFDQEGIKEAVERKRSE